MTARRTTRLLLTPVVVLVLAWILVRHWGSSGAVIAIPVAVFWLISGMADAVKVLTITPGTIQVRGYAGGPISVTAADAPVVCRYVPVRVRERSIEMAFVEIRDARGNTIKVWRYGWGRQTRALFTALGSWLEVAGAEVSPDAARVVNNLGAHT